MFQITDPCLLGSPIGGPQSSNQVLSTKKASLERLGERPRLLHSHDGLCLLKNALALPKVLYVLRTAPCFDSPILPELDSLQKSLLEDICNVHLSDEAWAQASLPVRAGGLGIRRFTKLATPAFLASAAGTSALTQSILPQALSGFSCTFRTDALSLWSRDHTEEPPIGPTATKQRSWDSPIINATVSSLLSSANAVDKACLLASQRKESGAWLNAPPVSSLGLRMDDDSVRIAVGLRLGVPLASPHQCVLCGNHVDASGTHGLHCGRSAGRHPRHANMNAMLKTALASINVPSILEPPGLFRTDGKRVDGITVTPWRSGRPLAWDFTCCDTFASTYLSLAASGAGMVAN